MFQGMTASLFPLNKCGLPGLTGPLTRTCNSGGQQLQTCCFFMLFPSFEVLFVSACVAIAPAERRLLWQKWAVQPLSHQPIVDSGWLHPSRIARSPQPVAPCTMTTGLRVTASPSSWLWRLGRHLSITFSAFWDFAYGMKWDQNGMSNHVKCQFRTESSYAVRSVSREASPSFIHLRLVGSLDIPSWFSSLLLCISSSDLLLSSSVNFIQFLWSFINRLVCNYFFPYLIVPCHSGL